MFQRMTIQNFQRHKRLTVDFDPGVTTIVGASDSGKSAVLRALRWVVTNTPGGAAFVSHGARGAVVRVTVDGHTITRKRSKSTNSYELDGQELKAFGTGVPDSIANLLNIGPENCQGQHDAPYWFTDTAGQVSRNLNAVIDLEIIDTAMGEVAGRVRQDASRLEAAEEQQTTTAAAAAALHWVPAAAASLDAVAAARGKAKTTDAKATAAQQCLTAGQAAAEVASEARGYASAVGQVVHAAARASDTGQQAGALADILHAAGEAAAARMPAGLLPAVQRVGATVEAAAAFSAAEAEVAAAARRVCGLRETLPRMPAGLLPAVQRVGAAVTDWDDRDTAATRLEYVVSALGLVAMTMATAALPLAAAEAAVEEFNSEGGCPLCGK